MKNLKSKLNIIILLATIACGPEEEQDMTAPEGGSILVEAVLNNAAVIRISEASDTVTPAENLSYALYYSQTKINEDVGLFKIKQHQAVDGRLVLELEW